MKERKVEEWEVHITIADDPANECKELCDRARLERMWPWLRTLLWDDPENRDRPTDFISMEFTVGLYHAEICLID